MRRFADLHLCPTIENLDQARRVIGKSSELGYKLVSIPLPRFIKEDAIRQLQTICNDSGVDFAKRIDLTPKTSRGLLRDLRRFRRRFEVVSVICASKAVARQAAKDRRVDILSFSATNIRTRFFDHAEAELASNAFSCLEIDMTPFLILTGFQRVRLISCLRREVMIAKKSDVPVIISSGASEEHLLRGPRDYAALASLFDLDIAFSLRALSEYPFELVERNRGKLSPGYLAPGLRVVKSGQG